MNFTLCQILILWKVRTTSRGLGTFQISFYIVTNSNMCINVHKMSILFLYFVLGLVTFDSLHIVFAILDSIRTSFRKLYPNFLMMIFPWFHFPLLRITLVGSIYMVISVSVERYLAVCFPHNYHRMNSQAFRFLYYIIPAAAAAIFVNVPKFFETQNDYRYVQL